MTRPRILVVDNDPQTCLDLRDLLEPFGFSVLLVEADAVDLIPAAIEMARQQRPHVVIVDLRLQDDYVDEYSGLGVLRHMQSAHCILYSAYLTLDLVRGERDLLYDWIRKHDHPRVLRTALGKATAAKAAAHSQVEVHWPSGLNPDDLAHSIADATLPAPPARILDDVVVQLCPTARQVELSPLKRTHSAPSGASRTRSAVFLAQIDQGQLQVLKFARSSQIELEERNYQLYVRGQMPAPFASQQIQVVKFWDIGGVAYTLMGAGPARWPTFGDHYHHTADPAVLVRTLRFFFQVVWQEYYRRPQPLMTLSLLESYEPIFDLSRHELAVNRFFEHFRRTTELSLLPFAPLTWALGSAGRSRFPTAQQAITHGDLHGDNLFVDGERLWAIDFERTGPGHILRDFAELEVDLLTRLVDPATMDPITFYTVARQLIAAGAGTVNHSAQANAEAQKVVEVVSGLRQIAGETVRFGEEEYLWAVLLDALFVASIHSAPSWQRERALILSSLIVEHLR